MIGSKISHYEVVAEIGRGGMGVVYRAVDVRLGRTVALKFLPPELTSDDVARERFVREAQAASALDHPNICTIHEIDSTGEGRTFIVMACYEGESLRQRLERGPLDEQQALDVVLQVAQGLAAAHRKGIVHRDIKPANIFLSEGGLVKILDFGLAKLAGRAQITRDSTTLGTAAYMAPERYRGEREDLRSDIWSLGVVLYQMLTGGLPFEAEYEQAMMYAVLNEEPEPPSSKRPGLNPAWDAILAKCLAKDPDQRYATVEELIGD
ncbi:MAG: serine/threonine protein kinase, partial [Calditrichaeota bacterium]|nr:serine/threonine protein kinase [Calditrichota bacterium]